MSRTISLYRSVPIHLSFVLYVICITLGTAEVVDCEEKEEQPLFCKECNIQQQWSGIFSLFWKQKECLIHCKFLHTYLNLHWLFQLAPSVCGGDFSGIKFGLCYGFSSQWRAFFISSQWLFSGCVILYSLYNVHIYFLLHLSRNFSMLFISLSCVTVL